MILFFLLIIFGGIFGFFSTKRKQKTGVKHSVQWLPELFVPQNVKQSENKQAKNETEL